MSEHFSVIKSLDELSKKFSAADLEYAANRAARAEANAVANSKVPMITHIPSATLTELPPMATHVRAQLEPPPKFVASSYYAIPPAKYRPTFDTLGPYAGCAPRPAACIPVVYAENGRQVCYPEAFWTPLFPGWVAASSKPAAEKLESDGFNVLPIEQSHQARCHYGGPGGDPCHHLAKKYEGPYTMCANLYENEEMKKKDTSGRLARDYRECRQLIALENASNRVYGIVISPPIAVQQFSGYSINDGRGHGTFARAMAQCNGPSIADLMRSLP